jgi:filamentous hemagglutinin family protein
MATPRNAVPRRKALAQFVTLACAALASGALHAAPEGGKVVGGQATIGPLQNGRMQIDQASQRAAIDWQKFGIGAAEWVHFQQPAGGAALNRVVGGAPSEIFGRLTATGQVFLVNPNGVLFARGASVDVGGLVASSLRMEPSDFMAGRYAFSGAGTGSVVNQGEITAPGGYVALIGTRVANEGTITARLGSVALAAGNAATLDVRGDGLISLQVSEAALQASVENRGLIAADGGQVLLTAKAADALVSTVLNTSGLIRAAGLVERDGVIRLEGGDEGKVAVSGTLDASAAAGGRAGQVTVLGRDIEVSAAASMRADAGAAGNGGSVIVIAQDTTRFEGNISARGGVQSGDGGFAEVSGLKHLAMPGRADLSAPKGRYGTLLLDPGEVTIQPGPNSAPGAALDVFNDAWVQDQLGSASVTISTASSTTPGTGPGITVAENSSIVWSAPTTLTLQADSLVRVRPGALIENTNAGTAAFDAMVLNGTGSIAGAYHGVSVDGATLRSSTGEIRLNGTGGSGVTVGNRHGVAIHSGSLVESLGSGGIWIVGRSGVQSGRQQDGVIIETSTLRSAGGPIDLDGVSRAFASGAQLADNSKGVEIVGSTVQYTGSNARRGDGKAMIRIVGVGAPDAAHLANHGVHVTENLAGQRSLISTTTGDIEIVGTGGGESEGMGIKVEASRIESLGTGRMTLTGTGGGEPGNGGGSVGVFVWSQRFFDPVPGSGVYGVDGDITIKGTGGNTGAILDAGVYLDSNFRSGFARIEATGTGNISIEGTGGGPLGGATNVGVYVVTGSFIRSKDGNLDITGRNNSTGSATEDPVGSGIVAGLPGTFIGSNGSGNVTLTGYGSPIAAFGGVSGTPFRAAGIELSDVTVESKDGNLRITGHGGGAGEIAGLYRGGIAISTAVVRSVGAGSVLVEAFGQGNSNGIESFNTPGDNSILQSGPGGFTLVTTRNQPVAGRGTIDLGGTGSYVIRAADPASTISLAGGAADLLFDSAQLARFGNSLSKVTFGDANATGKIAVAGAWNPGYALELLNTGAGSAGIDINAALSTGTRTLTLASAGTVTQSAPLTAGSLLLRGAGGDFQLASQANDVGTFAADTGRVALRTSGALTLGTVDGITGVTASAAGDAIVLAAGTGFANTAGAAPFSASNGRYLVYSTDPAGNTFGGFASPGNLFGRTYAGNAPASIDTAFGSRMVYSATPTLTISPGNVAKTYGAADPAFAYGLAGLVAGDTAASALTGSLMRVPGETVAGGPYAIDQQGTLVSTLGYNISVAGTGALTIDRAPLTVSPGNAIKTYGQADPAFAYSVSGLVSGDLASTALSGAPGRVAGESVAGGPYAINQMGTLSSSNYAITVANTGALTISRAPLTVDPQKASKVYGDADPLFAYSVTGLVGGDTMATALSGVPGRIPGESVAGGPYAINQMGTLSSSNYAITVANTGALTINRAPLTVNPHNAGKLYGEMDPTFGYSVAGLVGGDTMATALSGAPGRVAGESVAGGPYAISQIGSLASDNYALAVASTGTLAIARAPLTVRADDKSLLLGDALPPLTATLSGLRLGDVAGVLSGLALSANQFAGPGPSPIIATGPASVANYNVTYQPGTLNVGVPAPASGATGQALKVVDSLLPPIPQPVAPLVESASLFGGLLQILGGIQMPQPE